MNIAEQQYWIQEYNPAGDNWIDYCGFDDTKTLDQSVDDLKRTRAAFPRRVWRLIVRTNVVLDQ